MERAFGEGEGGDEKEQRYQDDRKGQRKRKIEDSDDEHPNIVIESATDSDKEEEVVNVKKRPVATVKKEESPPTPAPIAAPNKKSRKSSEKNNAKIKNVGSKSRRQTLLEFNCFTAPHLEIKELNDFMELRDMLKEYGVSEEYKRKLAAFPEEQLLTCDSDACPFLLEYERPFSALYEEARRKWTPSLESPSGTHLRDKCVNCDKSLSLVSFQTWKKLLGANSYYCSIKCICVKVQKVLKDHADAETVTVMNALTGETVHGGVYTRELKSFFLLSPNWIPTPPMGQVKIQKHMIHMRNFMLNNYIVEKRSDSIYVNCIDICGMLPNVKQGLKCYTSQLEEHGILLADTTCGDSFSEDGSEFSFTNQDLVETVVLDRVADAQRLYKINDKTKITVYFHTSSGDLDKMPVDNDDDVEICRYTNPTDVLRTLLKLMMSHGFV